MKQSPGEVLLRRAVAERKVAMTRYEEALMACIAEGMTNVRIARIAGVTEAGIRMYRKRHNL